MTGRPRRSVVTRLAVTFATGAGLLLILLIVATYLLVGRQLANQFDARLEDQALALIADVDPADVRDPIALAEDLWGEAGRTPVEAQLLRADGRVVASTGAVPGGGPLIDESTVAAVLEGRVGRGTIEVGDELLRLHTRPVDGTDLALVVASDLDPVTNPRQALLGVLVTVGVAGVLVLALLAWTSTRRALRPLERMAEGARHVGVGDLSVRLPVSDNPDELDQLGLAINRMVDRLQRHIERERRFTADASHELRTPLAIMRAELELAERHVDAPTRQRLASAREEIDRLAALVDDLLVLARTDADQLAHTDTVDLAALVSTVCDRFAPLADGSGIHLHAQAHGTVIGDARGLDRALSNLVDNALRHTPRGGDVDIRTETGPALVTISVSDTGPGVPEDQLPNLFHRFTSADSGRTSGGAGLGLAIVAAVAHAHGGSAVAHNRPAGGLRVSLLLSASR